MKTITRFTPSLLQNSTIRKIPFTIISSLSLNGRFKAIRILVLTGLAAVGLITSMLPAWGARNMRARFHGLGQMPGVVIQPGECGTQAFGISGDGSVIVGAGCLGNGPSGLVQEAFRWTVAGGYERLGDLGGGNSIAEAASFDGSVVVGVARDPNGNDQAGGRLCRG